MQVGLAISKCADLTIALVRKLMGPYLVFMSSTISGYEGTGRSLSLKLIKQLREQSRAGGSFNASGAIEVDRTSGKASKETSSVFTGGRLLKEVTLSEPIRYAQGDAVEKWLNTLLCLDATLPRSKISTQGCPVSHILPSTSDFILTNDRIRLNASFCLSTATRYFRSIRYPSGSCSRW
jgi:N-acetyltransferase 10